MVFDVPLHPSPSRPKLMTVKKKWTVIPGFLALAAAATLLSAYSGASTSQGLRVEQPVKFVHAPHVAKAGMNCLYCHSGANKAPDPGNASVQTCMGCHLVVKAGSAEIKKVADYYNKGLPIPWNRVHKVPDYVQFPHMRHVNAGVTCQSCHGDIAAQGKQGPDTNYVPVQQAKSLNMGWCINCHVNGYKPVEGAKAAGIPITPAIEAMPIKKARYDCAVCHY
ncbi:MAG: cytochrome c3 family protein [Gemmatimonadaceae bacterium]|jgi:Cytochrome c7 and related cytochrome c/Class III cytochrome C family|nr:cytochrome c3 family protein [Gemmatimonadaceae bacterium]